MRSAVYNSKSVTEILGGMKQVIQRDFIRENYRWTNVGIAYKMSHKDRAIGELLFCKYGKYKERNVVNDVFPTSSVEKIT
jgi:hypothetical protein